MEPGTTRAPILTPAFPTPAFAKPTSAAPPTLADPRLAAPPADSTSAQKTRYLYDGKEFAQWRSLWQEELKTERRMEAIEAMAAPSTRIVSLTITEGGYHVNQADGSFDDSDPDIRADIEGAGAPTTAFWFITEALARRRTAGSAPFAVMSCDNVQGNGTVARQMITAFATLRDPDLGAWISEHVAFPNSMVDRITPATTDGHRAELARRFGVEDRWPVVCEPWTQWVLEDRFGSGRPPLEDVGVQVVDDVEPYELMKLRLLNGSHQAMGYLGTLAGHTVMHEVCQDPLFATFLLDYMNREATPTLQPVPGIDLDVYKPQLIERFSNAGVRDTVARLAAESSDRIPKWLLPVVRENLASGGSVRFAATVVAAWARYAEGVDEQGEPIDVVDRLADRLVPLARTQREEPLAFLSDREVFGDLVEQPRFVEAYREALASLHARGARATVEAALRGAP